MREQFNTAIENSVPQNTKTQDPSNTHDINTPDVNTPPSQEQVIENAGVSSKENQNQSTQHSEGGENSANQQPQNTQNETRTAAQFYRDISSQVTDETPQQIREASAQKEQQMEEKAEIGDKRLAVNKEQAYTGPLKFRKNIELREQEKKLRQEDEAKQQEISQTNAKLQELRSPAQELNANIASDQEVARTLEPNRLKELSKANEPLPGQEASVRMIDQTPEQRQQRIGKEYGSLPQDERTEAQKEADILEQHEEYKRIGVEKLANRLMQEMQKKNQSIEESDRRETTVLWNINPEAIQLFSERAYTALEGEETILNSDIEKGYWGIRNEIKEIDGKIVKTTDEENQIDYLKHRAKKIEELQKETLVPMVTWQLQNELAQAMGVEPISAEEFVNEVDRISEIWNEEDDRHSHYLKKAIKYRESLPSRKRTAILQGISGNPESRTPWGTYFEGILQDIADFSRKRADNLSQEDIGTMMAYYTVALEEGIEPVEYGSLVLGIEFALQHILKNPSNENSSIKSVPDLVRQIRNGNEIKGRYRPDFKDITRAYQHMVFDARAFDLVTNF